MKVWKSDNTKKIASAASAFSTKKEKTESEGDYIVNYFKRAADPNAADDLEPMAAINIVMTTAKAKCGISITRLTLKAYTVSVFGNFCPKFFFHSKSS